MISLKKLKEKLLSNQSSEFKPSEFLLLHRYSEAYLKRVLLIGLRLRGAQYESSKKIVENTYLTTKALIPKCMVLLMRDGTKQKDVEKMLLSKYPDFIDLQNLFLEFTSKYRNILAHGLIDEIKDAELLDTLCLTNKRFIQCFERVLQSEFGHSAFDTPKCWGAIRGLAEDIEKTVSRLRLGSITSKPMTLAKAQIILSKTKEY